MSNASTDTTGTQSTARQAGRILGAIINDSNKLKMVAVLGIAGDWAAYGSFALPGDDGEYPEDDYIAHHGGKLHATEAAKFFPWLNPAAYRA